MHYSFKRSVQLGLEIAICLSSSLIFASSSSAQIPDYLQNELDRVGALSDEADRQIEAIQPEVQAQQQYEAQLRNDCSSGNLVACQEYESIQQRRQQWLIENDCRYRTGLNRC